MRRRIPRCTALGVAAHADMWIVTGLGNPGLKYSKTRHNIGFMVIDRLSEEYGIPLEEKETCSIGRGTIAGQRVVLLKPLTFMNLSGAAVKKILKKSPIPHDLVALPLIVIHDDLDIAAGILKIRKNGSSGGHRGVESIIREIGTKEFIRVKLGIGRDETIPVDRYVLSTFTPPEKKLVKDAIIIAVDVVSIIIREGVDSAMNKFNRSAGPGAPRA